MDWFSSGRKSSDTMAKTPDITNRPERDEIQEEEDGEKIRPTCADYLWLDKRARICYVIVLCVVIGIIAPILASYYLEDYQADLGKCVASAPYTFECLSGHQDVNEKTCFDAGCCWDNSSLPKCFHMTPTRYTYLVSDSIETFPSNGDPKKITKYIIHLKPERRQNDPFGSELSSAKVVIQALNTHHLVIQLLMETDDKDYFRTTTADLQTPFYESDFDVVISEKKNKAFSIRITRRSSDPKYPDVLLDTSRGPLIISQGENGTGYVEMTTTLGSDYLYGLGTDRRISFARNFSTYSKLALYNRKNYDSFHPFYLILNRTGSGVAHGVYWDNTNPLEVQLTPAPAISFRSTGGRGVLHLLAGPKPADVTRQFTKDIIGPIKMPPFWALGLHLCREANNATVFSETIEKMTSERLGSPIGFDSDCIDLRLSGPGSGTVDINNFPEAKEHRDLLQDHNKKFLLAQPPHITEMDDYPHAINVPEGSTPLEGKRLNAKVFYPSFPRSEANLNETHRFDMTAMFDPDGIMFVDNYPSNDVEIDAAYCDETLSGSFIPDRLNGSLHHETVCANAIHSSDNRFHFEAHNTYGIEQVAAFDRQRQNETTRPFYLNMASSIGNLGLAGHPGGDLPANWHYMKMALVQVLEMGLFGIPLSGSPICGSTNSTVIDNLPDLDEEQLCIRWYQMGLFLPLAHSLTRWNQRPRSPVDWSLSAQKMIANAIQERYRLLPYYYTLFYQASIPETSGQPIVRPLFYEFPDDNRTYSISDQFIIGDSILVCPMMAQSGESNLASRSCYFPPAIWYDYHSGLQMSDYISTGNLTSVVPPLASLSLYVRSGTVFVTQESGAPSAEENRANDYTVTTALPFSSGKESVGYLYVDDGYTSDPEASDYVRFTFDSSHFTITVKRRGFSALKPWPGVSTTVGKIRVFGAKMLNDTILTQDYNEETDILEKSVGIDWSEIGDEITIPLY